MSRLPFGEQRRWIIRVLGGLCLNHGGFFNLTLLPSARQHRARMMFSLIIPSDTSDYTSTVREPLGCSIVVKSKRIEMCSMVLFLST